VNLNLAASLIDFVISSLIKYGTFEADVTQFRSEVENAQDID